MRVKLVGESNNEFDGYDQTVTVEEPNIQGMADLLYFLESSIVALGFARVKLIAEGDTSTWTSEGRSGVDYGSKEEEYQYPLF